ncbi:MAG: DUF3090 family protein [Actinomycetota bacterium]|nr:DUF3090 family protein [Actinomycetota bacterium]
MDLEFDDPKRVTVGYLGVPGDRTFLLEVEDDVHRAQFQLEKAQVAGLGDLVAQLLARLDDRPPADWDRDAMSLEPPFRPIWRVGGIAVGLDTDSVRLLIELTEFVPEGDTEPRTARISMDRDQARRFAAHAVSIVGEGRARCRLCSRPIEVDGGHVCPGTNGHGPLTS